MLIYLYSRNEDVDFRLINCCLEVQCASETVHRTVSEDRLNKDNVLLWGKTLVFPHTPLALFYV